MGKHTLGRLGGDILAAQEEIASAALPPRFWEARDHIRSGIAQANSAGIENTTLAAVLFSEALPRLVDLYGPAWVATMLARMSGEIAAGHAPNLRQQ